MASAAEGLIEAAGPNVCRLTARVTPKGGRDRIDGAGEDAAGRRYLQLRVAAPPEDGAANKAVLALLAKSLGLRKTALRLLSGETSRIKRIEIDCPAEQAISALQKALSAE